MTQAAVQVADASPARSERCPTLFLSSSDVEDRERLLGELKTLSALYEIDTFEITGGALPRKFFDEVAPALKAEDNGYRFIATIEADLLREDLVRLRDAGFIGLKLRGAGRLDRDGAGRRSPLLDRVQIVRWCDELGIDTRHDLFAEGHASPPDGDERAADCVPSLLHLTPPAEPSGDRSVQRWREVHDRALLTYRWGAGWARIIDAREGAWTGAPGRIKRIALQGAQAEVYRFCDRARPVEEVIRRFPEVPEAHLRAFLERLVRDRLLLDSGERVLALALEARAVESGRGPLAPSAATGRREDAGARPGRASWSEGPRPKPPRPRRLRMLAQQ